MTDRELLEAAAKAAGIDVVWDSCGVAWKKWPSFAWNPLTDDGDALRLLVSLREELALDAAAMLGMGRFSAWSSDPYAAIRRAIVTAAAAMRNEA